MKGYVYAIGDSERVKIGWSARPQRRLDKLRADCPVAVDLLGVIDGDRAAERKIHHELRTFRLTGEWFNHQAPPVRLFVAGMQAPPKAASFNYGRGKDHPIAAYRAKNGLSVQALGKLVGISFAQISRYETRKRYPSIAVLGRLVAITGIPAAKLRPDLAKLFTDQ